MLKKEHQILIPFIKEPWKKFTFKDIKKLSRKKSESYVHKVLKRFVKEEILKEEKIGNVLLYYLNLKSLKTQAYAGFIAEYLLWNQRHIPHKDLENISDKIPVSFYILIITGSYANKTQKKDSDIDVVLIIDNSADVKKVYAELAHYCELNIPKIHLYVFRISEFISMLMDKKANYGKEIAKNNLIFFGAESYYNIIREVIENGFNG